MSTQSQKWIVLISGVLIQITLGGLYAWSLFVPGLQSDYGITQGQAATIFGLQIGIFSLLMIPGGYLLNTKGPKFTATLGALFFTLGYLVAFFSQGNFLGTLIGISVLAGTGTGLGYVCPLAVSQKWFPNRKGLISGITVAGFGSGAIVLTSIAEPYLETGGAVPNVFLGIALLFGLLYLVSARFLKVPEEAATEEKASDSEEQAETPTQELTLREALKTKTFLTSFIGLFAGTFSGLMIIGNLVPIALQRDVSLAQAGIGVSLFAVGNAAGRILWGFWVDKFGGRLISCYLLYFAGTMGLLIILPPVLFKNSFWLVSMLMGYGFGANFVIYASILAEKFGPKMFARIYPITFLAYGIAGILGPSTGGFLSDYTGGYQLAIVLSIALAGGTGIYLKKERLKKRLSKSASESGSSS